MKISYNLAQPIVNQTIGLLGTNVSVTDENGVIIASGDRHRVGSFHPIAARALQLGEPIEVSGEEAARYENAKEGISLPLTYDGQRVGVIIVNDSLDRCRTASRVVQALAELLIHQTTVIEQLGAPIGKQDHYAAAFGGLNVLTFHAGGVDVEPLSMRPDYLATLERSLMLFYTGASRNSSTILQRQRRATERNNSCVVRSLHAIKKAAVQMRAALESGDLESFGPLLDFAWSKKRQLALNISNLAIDNCYTLARNEGAWGGKITGAGGGGFLLLCAPEERHDRITELLEANSLHRMDFRFDFTGARVMVDDISTGPVWLEPAVPEVADLALAREANHRSRYRVVANAPTLAEGRRRRARSNGGAITKEVS